MARNQDKDNLKYLLDEPISLDESPIVKSLSEELKISDGKIIGLLGSWGSGKSSIIESIKKESFCELLEYDAWKNEGYPFKLGFLKFLIAYAEKIDCNDKELKNTKNQLDILQQIKDEKKSINFSIVNLPNTLITIALLFYPLAFKMIENKALNPLFLFSNLKFWIFNLDIFKTILLFGIGALSINYLITTEFKKHPLTFKEIFSSKGEIALNLFYLVVISAITSVFFNSISAGFIIFVPLIIWSIFNSKDFFRKIFGKTDDFYILEGTKPRTESIITINKTPEPNYSDFKDLYAQILNLIKEKRKNRKVVIVIDNIDRIDEEDAQNIWSCLKGIVLKEKTVNVIIPIDEKQVTEIYKANALNETDDDKTISFIQKTFDITFRVSPFIMTKAKDFWKSKLNEAFGNQLTETDKDEIISIFDTRNDKINNMFSSNYSGNLTPRKIIKLINEVVSLQKIDIFKDISIVTKFAYSLHYKNIRKQLQNHELIKLFPETNNILNDVAKNKQGDIAALYFTVSPNDAIAYVKEEELCKLISADKFKISNDDAKSHWIWEILLNGLMKKTNEPFSILLNTLSNLINLNEINPCNKIDYLLNNVVNKIVALDKIDKIRKNDGDILCKPKMEHYRKEILKIVKLALNITNDDTAINAEYWIRLIVTLTCKYNITKQELYSLVENNIPEAIYKTAIPLLKADECNLFDSYILEPENLEEALKNEIAENLHKHLEFIIDNHPEQDYINSWNAKMEKVVFPLIQKNINNSKMYSLLAKALRKKQTESIRSFIQTANFINPIQNITDLSECAVALATHVAFSQDTEYLRWRNYGQYTTLWQKLTQKDEGFIEAFVKAYLSYFGNNILKLLSLPDNLPNKEEMLNYAVNNVSKFNTDAMEYFTIYDENISKYPILKNLLSNLKNQNNFTKTVNALTFSDNNKQLLYVLAQETEQADLKDGAFEYFDTISAESWLTNLKTGDLNFKNALMIEYEGDNFISTIKQHLMTFLKLNPNAFIANYKNELPYLKQYDKKIKFVNDFLDDDLALDNYDTLLECFDASVVAWLKKTSHKNDEETIFTNFIRKINNAKWLIENKKFIKKFIITDDNKNSFRMKWQHEKDIMEAYQEIMSPDNANIK